MKVEIYRVTVNVGLACALASNRETGGIIRALKRTRAYGFHFGLAPGNGIAKLTIRTIWTKVNAARCDVATDVIGNLHRKVVSVNQRDIIIVQVASALQGPLGHRCRWDSCSTIK